MVNKTMEKIITIDSTIIILRNSFRSLMAGL